MIDTNTTLAALVSQHPVASAVFLRHQLDFCCRGQRPLAQACEQAGVDPTVVASEIEAEVARATCASPPYAALPSPALIDHIVEHYHDAHRRDMEALLRAAQQVERVHQRKPSCPRGLAEHLGSTFRALTDHMDREEAVLFPRIRAGLGVGPAIRVMRDEHDEHAQALARTRELTADLVAPPEACATWRSLYEGLVRLEAELMRHVHLENHVLFARVSA
jgi:regulator of cell morphogenesis and NO signaling